MADFGVTPDGFVPKTTDIIRSDEEARMRGKFGASLPLGDFTILGHLIGIVANGMGLVWQVLQVLYSAIDPDSASGDQLRAISLLTGTLPNPATFSTVVETFCGDDGTLISSGFIGVTGSTGVQFETTEDTILVAMPDWTATTSYIVGDQVNVLGLRLYRCTVAGTSSGSAPVDTSGDILDGSVHWVFLGVGVATADATMSAIDSGAEFAAALDLTVIQTPVGGLNTILNLADCVQGSPESSDLQLRLLREAELAADGTSPADAIRAKLLKLSTVTSATVFFNSGDVTDGQGRPPHSVQAMMLGGADQDIWNSLWANVAAGIQTFGAQAGTALDSQGNAQVVKFDRPTLIPIFIIANVIVDLNEWPADGANEVKDAIVTYGDTFVTGFNVVSSALSAQGFTVPGLLDITCLIGIAPSPSTTTTIVIDLDQLATFSTLNVTVNVTPGTP